MVLWHCTSTPNPHTMKTMRREITEDKYMLGSYDFDVSILLMEIGFFLLVEGRTPDLLEVVMSLNILSRALMTNLILQLKKPVFAFEVHETLYTLYKK